MLDIPEPSNDPHNLGYVAEKRFFKSVVQLGIFNEIQYETQLKKEFGWGIVSIDFLLVVENGVIPIQIKYRKTRRREDHGINNFIKSLDLLNKVSPKPVLFGVWLSRVKPFDDNEYKLNNKKVVCVSDYDSIDVMINKAISCITNRLTGTQHECI